MQRVFPIAVLACWFLSMGWLVVTKIAPLTGGGPPPDQRLLGPGTEQVPALVCWKIRWNDHDIGWARTEAHRVQLGRGTVHSVVRLENIPVGALARDLFGPLSAIVAPADAGDRELLISLRSVTKMQFDPLGMLECFSSTVAIDGLGELFQLSGVVDDRQLRLIVRAGQDLPATGMISSPVLYSHDFEIEPDVMVADALAPQPRLANLHLGQTWTFPTFRPFPPHQTMRLVRAQVERQEVMVWDADVEPMYVVSFTEVGGSGLTAAAEPFSQLWIRENGMVILQRIKLADMQLDFRRVATAFCADRYQP